MSYVDGYVLPVPEANKADYVALAEKTARLFKEFGATEVMECWSEDVQHGKVTDFYRATAAKEGEGVVFSWVIWPDKETRNAGWAKLMEHPDMQGLTMPFDGQRMFWGGFDVIVEHRS